jgi:uncharacterized protein
MSQISFSAAPAEERLEHIDLVRGYALLGVLLMNIQFWFRGPRQLYGLGHHPFPGVLNTLTDNVLEVWFSGKSVTIFAMLFAVGLCMQRDSILAKGQKWLGFGIRRLLVMLVLGALHVWLIWMGDILNAYALSGFLILPFLKRESKTLSWWVGSVMGLMVVGLSVFLVLQVAKGPQALATSAAQRLELSQKAQGLIQGYGQHSWWAVMKFRLGDFWQLFKRISLPGMLDTWFTFLVGLWVWKRNLLQNPAAHLATIRRRAIWGLALGLAMSLVAWMMPLDPFILAHWNWAKVLLPLSGITQFFGTVALALGLLFGLVWLWFQPSWRERVRPITFVGRMGFTNYITQSLVCCFVFEGWGLGWYGKLGPFAGVLIGLGLYAIQIPFSRWWLGRFRFGPLEWVWRSLSYGKRQPMLRPVPLEGAPAEA